jgi:hypothetical protein
VQTNANYHDHLFIFSQHTPFNHPVKHHQNIGIQYTPNRNPSNIETNRNKLHPHRKEIRQINRPWWKTLFVKNPPGNQKPSIHFD